ncbi:MAG: cobalamin biosynthesis protein CobQ [Ruminococcaceae bacterium]|nr:cobalamin biosynthesis protein CobQ [Oscillospiraceae bacterium]
MKHIIITGHYGSGKSNIAINLALEYAKKYKKVFLIDCDIVNPYFRSADSKELLEANGVGLIAPLYANTNLDIPALPPDIQKVFAMDCVAIWDIGGDDAGAIVLGRYADSIKKDGYEMYYVLNFYRPLTETAEEMTDLMFEIESSSKLKCTAIINNSNLGVDTDSKTVSDTFDEADIVSEKTGLPIKFTSVLTSLCSEFSDSRTDIFPINIDTRKYF